MISSIVPSLWKNGGPRKYGKILSLRMAPGVFVYGSLMSFRVLETLVYKVPKILPAYIPGMTRLALKTQVYPGLVKTPLLTLDHFPESYHKDVEKFLDPQTPANEFYKVKSTNHYINKVQGMVLKNLSDQQCKILDFFESNEFEKQMHPIVVGYDKNWNVEEANVYIYKDTSQMYNFWDFDMFCKRHLNEYLEMCAQTRMEFFGSLPKPDKYKPLVK